jgi:hypothetical protein
MIVIRDQQLRLMLLAHVIRELQKAAQEEGATPEGFTERQIEELQALTSAELVRLAEMPEPRVAIQIDAGSLEHGYFVRHGATSNMLTKLFKISSADVTLKRRLLSGAPSSLRRPSMPPHAIREKITQRWFEIRKGKEREPLRADDYELLHHEYPQYTFATLWAVIHEFDKDGG